MRIDSPVEPLVRENLAAVVARDLGRSRAATQAIIDEGDQAFADAVSLCYAVDNQLLCDLHGGPPGAESIASLAESATQMEAWAAIDQPTTEKFMTALVESQDPARVMLTDEATKTGFVVGAWLLSAFAPEDATWENVLDDVLAKLDIVTIPYGHNVIRGPWPSL
jgi:hypothetical protein